MPATETGITPLLTVAETARILSLSEDTIRVMVGDRRIGHVRIGKAVRIPESEVARIAQGGASSTTPGHI